MIALYDTQPEWTNYNIDSAKTKIAKNYWESPDLAGGSIVKDLKTPNQSDIKTDIVKTIMAAKTYGYYKINQV